MMIKRLIYFPCRTTQSNLTRLLSVRCSVRSQCSQCSPAKRPLRQIQIIQSDNKHVHYNYDDDGQPGMETNGTRAEEHPTKLLVRFIYCSIYHYFNQSYAMTTTTIKISGQLYRFVVVFLWQHYGNNKRTLSPNHPEFINHNITIIPSNFANGHSLHLLCSFFFLWEVQVFRVCSGGLGVFCFGLRRFVFFS